MGMRLELNLEDLVQQHYGPHVAEEEEEEGLKGEGDLIDCDYDSERGKFNCDVVEEEEEEKENDKEEKEKVVEELVVEREREKEKNLSFNANNLVKGAGAGGRGGMGGRAEMKVNKKIEYFENKLKPSKEDNRLRDVTATMTATTNGEGNLKEGFEGKMLVEEKVGVKRDGEGEEEWKQRKLVNILCLGSFLMTALLLYLFPLPN